MTSFIDSLPTFTLLVIRPVPARLPPGSPLAARFSPAGHTSLSFPPLHLRLTPVVRRYILYLFLGVSIHYI